MAIGSNLHKYVLTCICTHICWYAFQKNLFPLKTTGFWVRKKAWGSKALTDDWQRWKYFLTSCLKHWFVQTFFKQNITERNVLGLVFFPYKNLERLWWFYSEALESSDKSKFVLPNIPEVKHFQGCLYAPKSRASRKLICKTDTNSECRLTSDWGLSQLSIFKMGGFFFNVLFNLPIK